MQNLNQMKGVPTAAQAAYDSTKAIDLLLKVINAVATHSQASELLHAIENILHDVIAFDQLDIVVHDELTQTTTAYFPGNKVGLNVATQELRFEDGPAEWAWKNQSIYVANKEALKEEFPRLWELWNRDVFQSCCVLPLTTAARKLGAIELISRNKNTYDAIESGFLRLVADQIALYVDAFLSNEREREFRKSLAEEGDHLRMLLGVTNAVVSKLDMQELLTVISTELCSLTGHEHWSLVFYDVKNNLMEYRAFHTPQGASSIHAGRKDTIDNSPGSIAYRTSAPYIIGYKQLKEMESETELVRLMLGDGLRSSCSIPLINRGRTVSVLNVASKSDEFPPAQAKLLQEISGQLAIAVDNSLAYEEITQLKDRLASEKFYLEEELKDYSNFKEIIGNSEALRKVLQQVEMVAESDSTVLLLGETGTGKELIARAIHNLSKRSAHTMIKVNCAAIPAELLESDLFGHERGAFTGAVARKIGRFEVANNGTLLLDEIGDFPLELQPKLLRVLQEHHFERVGSTTSIPNDVRIIVATNVDLEQSIAEGKFRADLFYRINVFPIVIPPLRERAEDIPLLARHFAQKHARRMNRNIEYIPSETLTMLSRLPWPGNIRELENVIERAVIVSSGPALKVQLPELIQHSENAKPVQIEFQSSPDLEEMEREQILLVMKESRGIVSGPNGAAMRLGVKRSTLLSRMQRLGISPKMIRQSSRATRGLHGDR
ncbi:MAG: sigma 54-interacting transcriptional regulator [Acidobacteriaceae bacterium]|nr:sigma 54-interacting transcriptional regulator [Acidobacteriaceae bacterium]